MSSDIQITVTCDEHGRSRASSGSSWEPIIGYSRAIRVGSSISVSGTLGTEADGSLSSTPGEQTRRALAIIVAAVEALGGTAADIVRTRIFATDINQWEEIGRAHGTIFGAIRPATSMVEVSRLIIPEALVEIEADAILGTGQ
ncbi:RidA family protein [Tundrisphaera sp. TA3]|uniref:RidA family protein n=1 Tax=Tundrisphaera sp. TA3 TaxID=3435775 RepID=UPI003EBC82BC